MRHHRQKQVRVSRRARVYGVCAAKQRCGPVNRVVVQEVDEGRWLGIWVQRTVPERATRLEVLSGDFNHEAAPDLKHNAGRPDFDVQHHGLARREWLVFVVGMNGAVRHTADRIQLAVRGAQPPECQRHEAPGRAHAHQIVSLRIDFSDPYKNIHIGQ